jgi:hypothetical protein
VDNKGVTPTAAAKPTPGKARRIGGFHRARSDVLTAAKSTNSRRIIETFAAVERAAT